MFAVLRRSVRSLRMRGHAGMRVGRGRGRVLVMGTGTPIPEPLARHRQKYGNGKAEGDESFGQRTVHASNYRGPVVRRKARTGNLGP